MTILIITLLIIAIPMSILMLVIMACGTISAYNIHKYGCWWGKLPDWLANIVDLF